MDEFIKQTASQVGVEESQAKEFVGKIMAFVNKNSSDEVSKDINAKAPEVDSLVDMVKSGSGAENDMLKPCMPILEKLKDLLPQFFGGDAAKQTVEVTEIMTKSGVSPQQGAEMISKVLEFLKTKVGPGTVNKITEQVPALQSVA